MADSENAPAGRLAGRIALVTGASRGLGAATAVRFAAEGARLVLVARTVGGLEETDDAVREAGGQPATLVPLDLREFDKIDQLGASLYERFGRLDVLVGNAAVLGILSPAGHVPPAVWSEVMDVNVTANWRLIIVLVRDFLMISTSFIFSNTVFHDSTKTHEDVNWRIDTLSKQISTKNYLTFCNVSS